MKTLADYIAQEYREEDVRCGDMRMSIFAAMSDEPWPRRSDEQIARDAQARMDRVGTPTTMFSAKWNEGRAK
jgi:hypothetical protein